MRVLSGGSVPASQEYGEVAGPDAEQRQLIAWIEQRGGSTTVRAFMRRFSRFKTATIAETALDELVSAGLGRWECPAPGSGGGHPVKVFYLNDSADTDKTSTDNIASGGCVSVIAVSRASERVESARIDSRYSLNGAPGGTVVSDTSTVGLGAEATSSLSQPADSLSIDALKQRQPINGDRRPVIHISKSAADTEQTARTETS